MRLLPDRSTRLVAIAALAVVTTGACVQPDPPSVGIKSLAADIVFGATPIEEEEAQPAAFNPQPAAAVESEVDELPPQIFEPPQPKSFPRPPFQAPRPAPVPCPEAAIDEFPDVIAPQNVPTGVRPKEGVYRWKKTGTRTLPSGITEEITGFEQRAIRNVIQGAADPAKPGRERFTFEMAQPSGDRVAITRYAVDTLATSAEQNSPAGDLRVSTGEPERGVVIDAVSYTDASGSSSDRGFTPLSGLLLTPLPIRTGESFQSVAVDATTQQMWRYTAQLVKRDRVDACGEILDGWRTEGTLTVSGSGGGEREFTVIVSPQFGGIPIMERFKGTDADGAAYDITYTIGQLEPSPFPTSG
jgi:hypothetical protein